MLDYKEIFCLFSSEIELADVKEDFDSFTAIALTNSLLCINELKFNRLQSLFCAFKDKIVIVLKIVGYDENMLISEFSKLTYDMLKNGIDQCLQTTEGDSEQFEVKLIIEKKIENGYLTVYSMDCFAAYLEGLELTNLLLMIKDKIYNKKLYLLFVGDQIVDNGDGIIMSNKILNIDKLRQVSYEDHEHCHCMINGNALLIPRYYYPRNSSNRINKIFEKIAIISSICHLASYSEIRSNSIFIKYSGYKTIFGELSWMKMGTFSPEIFKICNWVYENKNIEDKRGIVLNILSLNIDEVQDILKLESDIYDSIISSHDLYLKENVNQYIQIKSVFIEHQIEMLSNISAIVDNIIDNFKKNFVGFFTFIISVVVLNSISTGKIDNIFNKTITTITYLLLAVSLLLLLLSLLEIFQKWKRQKNIIENTKKEYSDVLNKKDIDNIFNKSINIKEAKCSLIKNTIVIGIIWVVCIILIFSAIQYLNSIYQPQTNISTV